MVRFMPWPLYTQGKSPWYPLDRRLGGPQSHSGLIFLKYNPAVMYVFKILLFGSIAQQLT
jgi:hypothetical protein